ncbi:MAG: ribosome silencing factor [Methylococcales bacterium]|nr:ribosome silencing factor [Methylococcales bacterium]
MQANELLPLVTTELDERKGENVTIIDVKNKSSVTDFMVLVTATSERHGQALANYVVIKAKEQGIKALGVEGEQGSDWVLVDLGDIVLHIMTVAARELYQLEKLWSIDVN